jgi:DNA-binding NarL/FixJ family response regulator
MPTGSSSGLPVDVAVRITHRRASVLREIADGRTEQQAAETLGLSYTGPRSHVAALLEIAQCPDVRELGRWWRVHRAEWLAFMVEAAGAEFSG